MNARGLILGIESSCDETAAAVVERGSRTLSSVVASQIATHARYGGVVPELASREHLRAIVPVVRAALAQANVTLADLDAIAVTSGPGLAGALLVGITYAKALAFAQNLPLIAVNHLEGHIHAVLLNERSLPDGQRSPDSEPALALVVSGGHTHLYLARPANGSWTYTLVGRTLDDAAGEAFDKVAKLLGLGYPGGPWIDSLALHGNPHAVPFSFSQIKPKLHLAGKPPRTKAARTVPIANLDPRFLFSFSGIKTAVLRYVQLHNLRPEAESRRDALFTGPAAPGNCNRSVNSLPGAPGLASETWDSAMANPPGAPGPASGTWESKKPTTHKPPTTQADALALCSPQTLDLIASFQHAVVGDLMKKTFAAAESLAVRRILITGGVAANRELRLRITAEAARRNLRVSFPTLALSTDNAAMIAAAAWPKLQSGDFAPTNLSASPSLALGL
ncbi:MAG: tRNA (adenosine(37)-N6)-threonylcarbamoyltransferase complex transferase subunit TsaD [Terracidiphilus sp.]